MLRGAVWRELDENLRAGDSSVCMQSFIHSPHLKLYHTNMWKIFKLCAAVGWDAM